MYYCNTCKKAFNTPYIEDDALNDESIDLCPTCLKDDFNLLSDDEARAHLAIQDNGFLNQQLTS